MSRFLLLPVVSFSVLVGALACGGGGDGEDGSSACSVLKIAGGESCEVGPSAVAVVASDIGYCSGVFVTTRHVLTAAHCIPRGVREIGVASAGFRATTRSARVHPLYDGSISSPFDVAVVSVNEDAPVQPVPLMVSRAVTPGDRVAVYGFGLDEDGNDVVDRVESGQSALKATFLRVSSVDPGTIGSVSEGGDTCQGDSGGSLLLAGSDGQPGVVAIVRAGPELCVPESPFPSENSNVQSQQVVDFIRASAPGTRFN